MAAVEPFARLLNQHETRRIAEEFFISAHAEQIISSFFFFFFYTWFLEQERVHWMMHAYVFYTIFYVSLVVFHSANLSCLPLHEASIFYSAVLCFSGASFLSSKIYLEFKNLGEIS